MHTASEDNDRYERIQILCSHIERKCDHQETVSGPYMDMYNSKILSYSIGKSPSAQSINMTLDKAIEITSGCP